MRIYRDKKIERELEGTLRGHPWTVSEHDPTHRYVDFKKSPELIPDSLEDFQEWKDVLAVQEFFDLLRHLNRDGGVLETNDCGLKPPRENEGGQPEMAASKKLWITGRVMLLLRNLEDNMDIASKVQPYFQAVWNGIEAFESPRLAAVSIVPAPIFFPGLPYSPEGIQMQLNWWTWGDTEEEVFAAFSDVVSAIRSATDRFESEGSGHY